MNPLDKSVGEYVEALRDARRPTLEKVLQVIEEAFHAFSVVARKVADGSDGSGTWIWEELGMEATIPKYYVLTTSREPGIEGYPLLTIRQAYSTKLDTWVSLSSIIPGPDEDGISRSLALLIAQHACAFAGIRYCSVTCHANGGHPHAGVIAAAQLMHAEPMIIEDLEAEAEKLGPDLPAKREVN